MRPVTSWLQDPKEDVLLFSSFFFLSSLRVFLSFNDEAVVFPNGGDSAEKRRLGMKASPHLEELVRLEQKGADSGWQ